MNNLVFKTQSSFQINPSKTLPINEDLEQKNKNDLIKILAPCVDKINACSGYVLVTVEQDGKTFTNKLMGFRDIKLYETLMDLFANSNK